MWLNWDYLFNRLPLLDLFGMWVENERTLCALQEKELNSWRKEQRSSNDSNLGWEILSQLFIFLQFLHRAKLLLIWMGNIGGNFGWGRKIHCRIVETIVKECEESSREVGICFNLCYRFSLHSLPFHNENLCFFVRLVRLIGFLGGGCEWVQWQSFMHEITVNRFFCIFIANWHNLDYIFFCENLFFNQIECEKWLWVDKESMTKVNNFI